MLFFIIEIVFHIGSCLRFNVKKINYVQDKSQYEGREDGEDKGDNEGDTDKGDKDDDEGMYFIYTAYFVYDIANVNVDVGADDVVDDIEFDIEDGSI